MYIRVMDDIFDISNRIKEIDDGYYVLFDRAKKMFEVHNSKQQDTFCISCRQLNRLVLKKLHSQKTISLGRVLREIDENNQKIAEISQKNAINEAKEKFDDIMRYM